MYGACSWEPANNCLMEVAGTIWVRCDRALHDGCILTLEKNVGPVFNGAHKPLAQSADRPLVQLCERSVCPGQGLMTLTPYLWCGAQTPQFHRRRVSHSLLVSKIPPFRLQKYQFGHHLCQWGIWFAHLHNFTTLIFVLQKRWHMSLLVDIEMVPLLNCAHRQHVQSHKKL